MKIKVTKYKKCLEIISDFLKNRCLTELKLKYPQEALKNMGIFDLLISFCKLFVTKFENPKAKSNDKQNQ